MERYCFRCRRRRQSPCGPICRAYSESTDGMVARTQEARERIELMRKAAQAGRDDPAV